MFCKGSTVAKKRYERDSLRMMGCYVVLLFASAWLVKHDAAEGKFFLYFWSVIPAVPIIAVIWRMARYLKEEKDEYQRLLAMQSILVGTAALLAAVVISDFLRSFAGMGAVPPFSMFLTFCIGMAATQGVQKFRNRVRDDE